MAECIKCTDRLAQDVPYLQLPCGCRVTVQEMDRHIGVVFDYQTVTLTNANEQAGGSSPQTIRKINGFSLGWQHLNFNCPTCKKAVSDIPRYANIEKMMSMHQICEFLFIKSAWKLNTSASTLQNEDLRLRMNTNDFNAELRGGRDKGDDWVRAKVLQRMRTLTDIKQSVEQEIRMYIRLLWNMNEPDCFTRSCNRANRCITGRTS